MHLVWGALFGDAGDPKVGKNTCESDDDDDYCTQVQTTSGQPQCSKIDTALVKDAQNGFQRPERKIRECSRMQMFIRSMRHHFNGVRRHNSVKISPSSSWPQSSHPNAMLKERTFQDQSQA